MKVGVVLCNVLSYMNFVENPLKSGRTLRGYAWMKLRMKNPQMNEIQKLNLLETIKIMVNFFLMKERAFEERRSDLYMNLMKNYFKKLKPSLKEFEFFFFDQFYSAA